MTVVTLLTTARDQDQPLAVDASLRLGPALPVTEDIPALFVDPERSFQTHIGIGAAVTDASAEVFSRLPEDAQRAFLHACWDREEGNGYSLSRTSVHSCDFSPESYSYVEEGDHALATFSIERDRRHRIPMLRAAKAAAGGELTLFASPWSAPAFMKDNGSMLEGGRLLPECRRPWADYLVHFLKDWAEEDLPFWGLTVQNEPAAVQRWESMVWTAEEERDFVRDHLAPALAGAGLEHLRIIGWDHNRDLLPHRAEVLLGDPESAALFWGLGFHWYETWSGSDPLIRNVAAVAEAYPDKGLLLTEGCFEGFEHERLYDWTHGEHLAHALIGDLGAGACGWIAWNVLLDMEGGPNHVGNYCFAPVHGDAATGALHFTPSHHVLGHFSRYLRPGARRIAATSSRSALSTIAYRDPGGRVVVVLLHDGDEEVEYVLHLGGNSARLRIPARAIQTLLCDA